MLNAEFEFELLKFELNWEVVKWECRRFWISDRSSQAESASYPPARSEDSTSRADFIAKLGTVIEEADESDFWLDLTARAALLNADAAKPLRVEAGELIAIFTQSQKTARARL